MTVLRRVRVASPEDGLVAAASRGDQAAFERLRRAHEPAVSAFCAGMLEEEHRAEVPVVVAEVFDVARRELGRKDRRVELRPWLHGLAFERCIARLDRDAAGGLGQGTERDQRRGAALMLGALPAAEVETLVTLAGSRPALFGLVSELTRSAPGFLGSLAVDQAAGQAIAALANLAPLGRGADDHAAKHAAAIQLAPAPSAHGLAQAADRVRNATRIAAVTGGAIVVGGASVFALADPIGRGARGVNGASRLSGASSASQGARGSGMRVSPSALAAEQRDAARRRGARGSKSRDGAAGANGLAGAAGAAGAAGRGATPTVIRETAAPAPTTASSTPDTAPAPPPTSVGATDDGRRPLVQVDARVGPVEAHVKVP
jgi:hypothetical protein